MDQRKYYEAYDDRYRQVHEGHLQWFSDVPSGIVGEVIARYGISTDAKILEIGCGEGRDAKFLLHQGFHVIATDISPEAVAYCRREDPLFAQNYRVVDCIGERLDGAYDFLYAIAVIHMLVENADRAGFYRFVHDQLAEDGIALICTMGDGVMERCSDTAAAFELQERRHQQSGKTLLLAGTSCRIVSFETFLRELEENGLSVCEHGLTAVEPDFPVMMYAVVKRKS